LQAENVKTAGARISCRRWIIEVNRATVAGAPTSEWYPGARHPPASSQAEWEDEVE